jgi:hypothetical protein
MKNENRKGSPLFGRHSGERLPTSTSRDRNGKGEADFISWATHAPLSVSPIAVSVLGRLAPISVVTSS